MLGYKQGLMILIVCLAGIVLFSSLTLAAMEKHSPEFPAYNGFLDINPAKNHFVIVSDITRHVFFSADMRILTNAFKAMANSLW
jgi:hypothetical protein